MDKTDEQLATLIERLQEAGFAQAPEVINGAIRAIQGDGYMQLGVFGLLVLLLMVCVLIFVGSLSGEKDHESLAVTSLVGGFFTLVFLLVFGTIDNPWIKVFDPEASFYQQLIEGIL